MTSRWIVACIIALVGLGCGGPEAKTPAKAAKASDVQKLPGEADLTAVTLSAEAVERLGIETAEVVEKSVVRTRTLGGEVMVPPGHQVTVSAPLNGTLQAPSNGTPEPGARVVPGQTIFELVPILSPEAEATLATTLAEAQGQVDQAEKQLAQSRLLLERSQRLFDQKLGGTGAVADATAQVEVLTAAHKAAIARRDAFERTIRNLEKGTLEPEHMTADDTGVLRNLLASPGQMVSAGAPLFEVMMLDPLLVRVPVYVGDLERLDTEAAVQVGGLSDLPGAATKPAVPVPAPPSADPLGSTADLYYRVENADESLRPGQRVGVTLRLKEKTSGQTVPAASVLRDYNGGAWVYTVVGPETFVRQRVGISSVVGEDALLRFGPPTGTKVVTTGAAELFGIEFGGNK